MEIRNMDIPSIYEKIKKILSEDEFKAIVWHRVLLAYIVMEEFDGHYTLSEYDKNYRLLTFQGHLQIFDHDSGEISITFE